MMVKPDEAAQPRVAVTEHGPFMVQGRPTIRRAEPVVSELGEPMTWRFGAPLEPPSDGNDGDGDEQTAVALCRCGHSGNRPFCDGSHESADWDSTDGGSPEAPYAERARRKEGTSYTLLDDPPLCMHAGQCGSSRRTVWQMLPETDDTETRATVIRMVEKCPSGRLTSVIDGDLVEPSLPSEINVVPGGPLWMTGGIPVDRADGTTMERRNRVTLCRCGASGNKPLCDGSHQDIGFEGIE